MKVRIFAVLAAVFGLLQAGLVQADVVKKTSSGICHPPASSYYDRIQNFEPFSSLDSCVATGGRLPKNLQVARAETGQGGYSRSQFGHGWDDADGDCQNSRMEALAAQSTAPVRYASDKQCRVVAGRWISPFTGKVIHDASAIDIDHVVPLKWAWDHGADQWSRERREQFANDLVNLWSVELSLNRQKGAKGPDQWLPPAGQCQYVSRFLRVVKGYSLKLSNAEAAGYREQVSGYCG
ncbi:HNH endonuclease family protein [Marinobacter sp. JSM 1782161]|uniref:HNH endonuclease family protein n=1 Tax=Marinobacter sp. JSM 1782161 TaxID=2685906 RepID=UPI001403BDC5|nr:HNH endonuclease family protein [Marinobacter sp. JSM 1782161]